MKALAFTLLLLTVASTASAQVPGGDSWYLGIAPGGALRWQDGDVRSCPLPDCAPFVDGSGAGFGIALRALYPLGGAFFLRGGAGWETAASSFTETRRNYPILGQNYEVEYVDMRDEMDLTISTLMFEAGLAYEVLDGAYLSAGPALILPLAANWKQTETITDPSGVVYTEGGRSVVLLDDDIPDLSAYLGVRLGAGALLPIGDALLLSPELHYTLPLG
ncbi:MAG: hypothetical protein RRA94_01130, partial [Bacteroidota bacterium]|nr:hypothetical protein [Bacteroidota bacterium]